MTSASVFLQSPVPTQGAQPVAAPAQRGLRGRRGASRPEIREGLGPETEGPQTRTLPPAAAGRSLPHRSLQRGDIRGMGSTGWRHPLPAGGRGCGCCVGRWARCRVSQGQGPRSERQELGTRCPLRGSGVTCAETSAHTTVPPSPQSDSSSAPAVSPEPGVPPPPPRLALSPQTRAGASLWFLLQLEGQTGWAERCPLTCAGWASARRAPSQDHARRGTSAVPGPSWGPWQRRSGETG